MSAGKAAATAALVVAVLATFLLPEPRDASVRKPPTVSADATCAH